MKSLEAADISRVVKRFCENVLFRALEKNKIAKNCPSALTKCWHNYNETRKLPR
jgi:hypothetical protein